MIIELLMDLLYNLFALLTAPINIPDLNAEVLEMVDYALGYIGTGIAVLSNYVHLPYLLILFGMVAAIEVGVMLYKMVMFFLKKIPMLGIE